MLIKQLSNRAFSLIISAIYVGVGTLYVLLTDQSEIIELTDGILYYLFWPATSVAVFLVFAGGDSISFIIGESLVIALVFLIVHGFTITFRKAPNGSKIKK